MVLLLIFDVKFYVDENHSSKTVFCLLKMNTCLNANQISVRIVTIHVIVQFSFK